MSGNQELKGPDLTAGVPASQIKDGEIFLGHAGEEGVVLVRRGVKVFAVSATCTHYSGPLAEGIVENLEIRCPYHHARFNLETGEPVGPPALNPITCFSIEEKDGKIFVRGKKTRPSINVQKSNVESVVIVGAGAAGNSA